MRLWKAPSDADIDLAFGAMVSSSWDKWGGLLAAAGGSSRLGRLSDKKSGARMFAKTR